MPPQRDSVLLESRSWFPAYSTALAFERFNQALVPPPAAETPAEEAPARRWSVFGRPKLESSGQGE